ncbi:MAG: type I methionyl aminopeptidase [Armatimonadota bacterium]|nr:type I methionyl aminopeptidase [Armatimonadota bacterium]
MRTAGKVVAQVLKALEDAAKPGATTADLDELAAKIIRGAGGRASFLHYEVSEKVYPAHICTSINEEVVHGIPGPRTLRTGDIVGVDVGVFLNGFHADSAATFAVGQVAPDTQRLLDATQGALAAGVSAARAGRRVGHISHAVQRYAESRGFHVVKALVGHGVGRQLHEEPNVPNFGQVTDGEKLQVGMTLAVEPMLSIGTHEVVGLEDDWTIMTADGSLSAHFEHTIAITRDGADILTL